ncbi:MAG: WecB/TagA/CpsF family glycosyltransferase [Patescibacteria group bacterium]
MDSNRTNILGVMINSINKEQLTRQLRDFFYDEAQHTIVTPNPEMILLAQHDKQFLQILNNADIAVPDGVGLIFASHALGTKPISSRITGVETLELLTKLCVQEGKKLILIGGGVGVASVAAENLNKKFHTSNIRSYDIGEVTFAHGAWSMNPAVLEHIKKEAPALLAVALGHGKQEKWIASFLPELPSVHIAIGVGGALDYLAGHVPRAPRLMRQVGLEWLYRLIREPKRLPRIWKAVIVFPLMVIWARIKHQPL